MSTIDAFVDNGQGALLISGELGAGKTVLWEQGVARAGRLATRVLAARPIATEAALGYTALADLLDDAGSDPLIEQLPAPQRRALRVALLREDAGTDPPPARTVATAMLGVLRAIAASGPLLLAIDDIAYLDQPSARVLSFALRRIGEAPVRVLATVRTDDLGDAPPLVTDSLGRDRVALLRPRPLRKVDVRALLADRLPARPAPALVNRVWAMSGGNPYLALELGRALAQDDGGRAGGADPPVPLTLRRLVRGRLAALAPPVRAALLVAALAPTAPLEVIIEALATDDARTRLEHAAAAGVVHLHTGRVVFTQPLLRSVVIDETPPADRRAAHRRLARHAPTSIERAVHLAHSRVRPDQALAAQLDAAAAQADAKGLPDAAAELADLAVAATPRNRADARPARLLAAAGYRFAAGDADTASATVRTLVAEVPAGPVRARALDRLAVYQRYRGEPLDRWQATLRQALAEAPADDPALLLRLHYGLGVAAMNSGDVRSAAAHVGPVVELAQRCADPLARAMAAAAQLLVAFTSGEGVRAQLLSKALSSVDGESRLEPESRPGYTAAVVLALAGHLDKARAVLVRDYAEAADRGDEAALPLLLWPLILVETWSGEWTRAQRLAAHAIEAASLSDVDVGVAFASAVRSHLYAGQGEVAQALADAATAQEVGARIGVILPRILGAWGGGLAALSAGDARAAHELLGPLADEAGATGMPEPGLALFVTDDVEARVRLGDLDSARTLLDMFTDRAELLGRDRARAAAGRARGLLLAAAGRPGDAVAELDRAARIGANLGLPLEYARTLLVASEVHRRARDGRQARQRLSQARSILADLGARQWLAACDGQLSRYEAVRRVEPSGDGLTPTERRVAELAALGRTTKEIADAIFASPRTVETHLHRVYRKLGVRSRVELTRRLVAPHPPR